MTRHRDEDELNDREKLFVRYYTAGETARKGGPSAIRAGYSARSADALASRLLKKVKVKEEIDKALDARNKKLETKLELTDERIILELMRMAFFDIRKLVDDDGNPIGISKLDDETAAALQGLDVVTFGNADAGRGTVLKIKMADKKGALELLMRQRGMLNDKLKLGEDADNPFQALVGFLQAGAGRIKPGGA
jgi:phage terminase small subunit